MQRIELGNRSPDTDIMRILCSFLIVLLHTVTYAAELGRMEKDTAHTINVLCRCALPVFIMISGRYMLSRDRSVREVTIKSGKTLFMMLVTSFVYLCGEYIFFGFRLRNAEDAVSYLLTEPIHLWYLYASVCLYIFTPIIRVFVKNASKRQMEFAIAVCLFIGSILYIPLHDAKSGLLEIVISKCHIDCSTAFFGCYMLGFYFHRFKIPASAVKLLYAAGLIALIFSEAADKEAFLSFFAPNVIAQSAALFMLIQECCGKFHFKPSAKKLTFIFSGCTLWVYLFHLLVLKIFMYYTSFSFNFVSAAAAALLTCAVCIAAALAFSSFCAVFKRRSTFN